MKIYLECKPDEQLMRSLGVTRKVITHANDKGRVCNYLKNCNDCKGLMDEDPGKPQPSYLQQLVVKQEKYDIKVMGDQQRNHTIIVLCPDLETWIVNTAKKTKIALKDFGLPDNSKELHKVINFRFIQFNNLITTLEEKRSKPLLYLKSLLLG